MTTAEKVMGVLEGELKVTESVMPESTFEDLGVDSLEFIGVIQSIDEAFRTELSDEAIKRINTVGELITEVENALHISG